MLKNEQNMHNMHNLQQLRAGISTVTISGIEISLSAPQEMLGHGSALIEHTNVVVKGATERLSLFGKKKAKQEQKKI